MAYYECNGESKNTIKITGTLQSYIWNSTNSNTANTTYTIIIDEDGNSSIKGNSITAHYYGGYGTASMSVTNVEIS